MDRHFILPLTIAAAVHAGLLFGIRGNPAAPSPEDKKPGLREILLRPFEIFPEAAPETGAAPALGSVNPAPSAPEPPPMEAPPAFTVDPPVQAPVAPLDLEVIPLGQIGVPIGDVRGTGTGGGDPFRIVDLDSPPRTRLQVPPIYPFEAKHDGRGGNVLVEFTVDEQGAVVAPRVVRSDDRIFEEPTLRAVSRWRFEPGKRGGHVVRFRMAVPVVFNLGEN